MYKKLMELLRNLAHIAPPINTYATYAITVHK